MTPEISAKDMVIHALIKKGSIGSTYIAYIYDELYAVKLLSFLSVKTCQKLKLKLEQMQTLSHPNLLPYVGYSRSLAAKITSPSNEIVNKLLYSSTNSPTKNIDLT